MCWCLCYVQSINEELKLATEAFFESDSLILDVTRREVCNIEQSNYEICPRNIEFSIYKHL